MIRGKSRGKSVVTSLAALAVASGLIAGGAALALAPSTASPIELAALGAPLPMDPAPATNVPTADQVTNILTNLSDPGVSYHTKDGLVEGGIGSGEGHIMDHELRKAYRNGELPLTFAVSNIQPTTATTASADVAVSGPKLPAPVTKNLTFVNQPSGWVLASPSATELVQAVSGL